MRISSLLALFLLCLTFSSCGKKETQYRLSGEAMGTGWNLSWRGRKKVDPKPIIEETLEKWEQILSPWRANSDISRANAGEPPSPELKRVIAIAEEIRKQSAGAFDLTLLEQTHQAGFGPPGKGMDLSGIGKGFSVDRVVEALENQGFSDFSFDLGGEVRALGGEWPTEIAYPGPSKTSSPRIVNLKNHALATSGNFRESKPAPAGLASHIIDPVSGKSVVRAPCSVTVIAKDCATADAWATALFVLGPEVPAPAGLEVKWSNLK